MLSKLNLSVYQNNGIKIENAIHANEPYLKQTFDEVDEMIFNISNGNIQHILCGEISSVFPTHAIKVGCLNEKRIEQTLQTNVVGIKDRKIGDNNVQRSNCLCVITDKGKKVKRQALTHNDKCGHSCIGCYIHNNTN